MRPVHFAAIVAITAATWSTTIYLKGFPATWMDALWPFASATTVLGFSYLLFEKVIWSLAVLRGWFVDVPDVSGTWRVTFQSSWKANPNDDPLPPKIGYAHIRQSYRALSVRFFTDESASISIAWSLNRIDGVFEFVTVYRNEPKIGIREERSPIHYGSFRLNAAGYRPNDMDGWYWTDRKTNGSLRFEKRRTDVINSYAEGQKEYRD